MERIGSGSQKCLIHVDTQKIFLMQIFKIASLVESMGPYFESNDHYYQNGYGELRVSLRPGNMSYLTKFALFLLLGVCLSRVRSSDYQQKLDYK